MTTNYGERPGMSEQAKPRTMSAKELHRIRVQYDAHEQPDHKTCNVCKLLAELDAERAVTRELCEALERCSKKLDAIGAAMNLPPCPESFEAGIVLAKARGEAPKSDGGAS